MDSIQLIAIAGAGFLAGFVNTVAGGGSLLTLPLLIFLGLPPAVANGTNRIAILMQNATSISTFFQSKLIPEKLAIKMIMV